MKNAEKTLVPRQSKKGVAVLAKLSTPFCFLCALNWTLLTNKLADNRGHLTEIVTVSLRFIPF
jgi:hypothetical protein